MATAKKSPGKPQRRTPILSETVIFGVVLVTAVAVAPFFYKGQGKVVVPHVEPTPPMMPVAPHPMAGNTPLPTSLPKPPPRLQIWSILASLQVLNPYLRMLVIDAPSKLLRILFLPLGYILSVLYQLLSPVVLLFRLVSSFLIVTPWNIATWVGRLLYPIYVFCAVAALVGASFGLLGVLIGRLALWMMTAENTEHDGDEWEEEEYKGRRGPGSVKNGRERDRIRERPGRAAKEKGILKEEWAEGRTYRKKGKSVGWAD